MATRVHESAVIEANIDAVWGVVKVLDFRFLSSVVKCDLENKASHSTVGGVRRIQYKDQTVQRIRLLELSDAQNFVSWEVFESVPALTYSGAIHTIKLRRVTEDNHTFVQFTSDYSKDAGNDVIVDSRFKKLEYFKALSAVTEPRVNQFLRQLDFSSFKQLSAKQVDDAWAAFDTNKDGTLDAKEIGNVVDHILTRIAAEQHVAHKQLENTVHSQLRFMFEEAPSKEDKKDVKKDDKKDSKHAVAVAAPPAKKEDKEKKDIKKEGADLPKRVLESIKKKVGSASKSLIGKLDRNRDGKVDKAEFTVLFPGWFEKQVRDGIRASYF
jgi:hypothetical protein